MAYQYLYPPEDTQKLEIYDQNSQVCYLPFGDIGNAVFADNYTTSSLLRYPGGKTRAVKIISRLIPSHVSDICSPFFGGGSIEIYLAANGVNVYGYDIFSPLVDFWYAVQTDSEYLAELVNEFFPLPKENFYELQAQQEHIQDRFQRAAIFYVLNRSSFSGSTLSGGMSPKHPRFTKSSIKRLREFYNPNFSVECLDFKESICKHPHLLLYMDPPYLIKTNLYGNNGNTHRNFDHEGLYNLLKNRGRWILSYNNCPEILKKYRDFKILFPKWSYGMSNVNNQNVKESKEVVILSNDIKDELNL